jgi:signal transduction histidine kinase
MKRNPTVHSMPVPLLLALAASTVIVIGSAWLAREHSNELEAASETVLRSGDTLDAVTRLQGLLNNAETSQRGYLMTAERDYLAPYERALPLIKENLAELKRLVGNDQRQVQRLAALEKQVATALEEMRGAVAAIAAGDRATAARIMRENRGREAMDALRPILAEIRNGELQEWNLFKDRMRELVSKSRLVELLIFAVFLSQLALLYFLLLRYLRERREAEQRLEAQNARLEEDVRARTAELRDLSRYLMSVREEEKSRIARELHDEMGSGLTAVNMDIMSVRQRVATDPQAHERLSRAAETLKATVQGMRRIIEDLRPTMLESLGLREAVRSWAKEAAERGKVGLRIDIPDELPPLPAGSPIGLFRIVQEAVSNALKHAQAKSIRISLHVQDGGLVLEVVDDGVGIPVRPAGSTHSPHGLLGIRERALAMGGTCTIGPASSGRGTEVRVTVPLAKVTAAKNPA